MALVNDPAQEVTPVSGTVTAKSQDGAGNALTSQLLGSQRALDTALNPMAAATSNPTGVVSLGNSLGKTNKGIPGSLASVAATADQVIVTYTVTAGKTFYLTGFAANARLTTFAATATYFGTASLEAPSGTKLVTTMLAGAGIGDRDYLTFPEPLAIASATVIRIVCTPSAATAFTWQGNLIGYEK